MFQSGISWQVVEAKWTGTREAFKGFDPVKVANLTPKQVDALAADTRLIRNRKKIEAIVGNAETILALDREHGGFRRYLRSFAGYDELQHDLVERFKFLGQTGAYYFLYCVGEKVPAYEEWNARYGPTGRTSRSRAGARRA